MPRRWGSSCAAPAACGARASPRVTSTSVPRDGEETIPDAARAVVSNATVVNGAGGGYGHVTLWPSGAAQPTVCNLSYTPGRIVPDAFTVGLGASDGAFELSGYTRIHFIVDEGRYFAPSPPGSSSSARWWRSDEEIEGPVRAANWVIEQRAMVA